MSATAKGQWSKGNLSDLQDPPLTKHTTGNLISKTNIFLSLQQKTSKLPVSFFSVVLLPA